MSSLKIYSPPRVVLDTTLFQHMSSLISTPVQYMVKHPWPDCSWDARDGIQATPEIPGVLEPGRADSEPSPCWVQNHALKEIWTSELVKRPSLSCLRRLWKMLTGCVIKSPVPRGGSQHLLSQCLITSSSYCWKLHLTRELAFEAILSPYIRFKYLAEGKRYSFWRLVL